VPYSHPPDQHPGYKHLGESCAQYGVAVFVGDWAISQLWLFWVAPIIGGMIGAVIYRFIGSEEN